MTDIGTLMNHDHDRLGAIFADFCKSRGGRLMRLFSQFESGLRAHIAWEEEILFPPFEARTAMEDSVPTAVMRAEHERIKQLLQSIREQIDRGCQRVHLRVPETGRVQTFIRDEIDRAAMNKSAKNLLDLLVPHHHKEDRAFYLSLERILNEEQRQALVDRMQSPPPGTEDRHSHCRPE